MPPAAICPNCSRRLLTRAPLCNFCGAPTRPVEPEPPPADEAEAVGPESTVDEAADRIDGAFEDSARPIDREAAYRELRAEGVPADVARAAVAEAARRAAHRRSEVRRAGGVLLAGGAGLLALGSLLLWASGPNGYSLSCLAFGLPCAVHGGYQLVRGRGWARWL